MAKLWEQFKGHRTEIALVSLAVIGRLADSFPGWEYWPLLKDILTILAGGAIGSRVVRVIKNGNGKPPVPPAGG